MQVELTTVVRTTPAQLVQASIDCLMKAFNGDTVPVHVVQAAAQILSAATPPR